jgi:hypothetical protein
LPRSLKTFLSLKLSKNHCWRLGAVLKCQHRLTPSRDFQMTETTNTETGKTLGELAKDIVTQPEPTPTVEPNNGELLKLHELKIIHFRPTDNRNGMTIAFKQANRNVIEVATSIVHPFDTFTKKVGTRLAIEAFVGGRTAFLPIRNVYGQRMSVTDSLHFYFD